MKVISVNIAPVKKTVLTAKKIETGIFKEPLETPVFITSAGLTGDNICNTKYHGGIDQAVYIYGTEDYKWWQEKLGRDLLPGTFGENLTITALCSSEFAAGDHLNIADVILEVTAPRLPCATFASKMADPTFVKKFKNAQRPGLYCRVTREGIVRTGDTVRIKKYNQPTVTILEMFKDGFNPVQTETEIRRFLNAPISIRERLKKEEKLRKILAG